jgi:two-component system CheB/CheR fusion protein
LTEFFQNLSVKLGMAYVIIQHLDPKHESIMAQLLSKSTAMPIKEAKEGMPVEPNCIYIIPPPNDMTIMDGTLKLVPRPLSRSLHMPIDVFCRSLSEVYAGKAIGIILSGTGTDGALGMQEIKNRGGITFVQDPQTAKFDGMPRSASLTGCIDFSLTLPKIAEKLAEITHHPSYENLKKKETAEEEVSLEVLPRILTMLRSATGLDFTQYKPNTIQRRIQRRMILLNIKDAEIYADYLKNNRNELVELYQDMLIKVTSFFRDPDLFETLKSQMFSELFKNKTQDNPIRLWISGCSTGEEVYSLAICILEWMSDNNKNLPVQLFGTDVSEKAIEVARSGKYIDNISMDVSPERLRRFFSRSDNSYQVSKSVRDMCVFSRQNLLKDPPFSRIDLISCRNVLIYLQAAAQKKVMSVFHFALNPTGLLVLGISEMAGPGSDLFSIADKKHKIFSKNVITQPAYPEFPSHRSAVKDFESEGNPSKPEAALFDSQKELDRILLQHFGPTAVLVNENMDILQLRGDTSRYLYVTGTASFNLTKMSPENFVLELIGTIQEAKAKGGPCQKIIKLRHNEDQYINVNIEVIPIMTSTIKQQRFAVLFHEVPLVLGKEAASQPVVHEPINENGLQLKQELESTKLYLRSIIDEREVANEELQSANEEILSSNEELQSINEELQTAKEELQSTNEELTTLNEELHTRNTELGQVNNDLLNLVSSVQIPIIMLGGDLRIRRYSPLSEKILNLIPTDIGRPISDIRLKVNVPDFEKLILESIDTVSVQTKEAQDLDGQWYSVMVRPYKTLDNKIDGAVLVFWDIDVLKKGSQDLTFQSERLHAANKDLEMFVDHVAQDLRIPLRHALTYLHSFIRDYSLNLDLQGKTYLELAENSIQKMSETFNDVLSLTRIVKSNLIIEEVDLSVLAEEIVTDIHNSDLKRKVKFAIASQLSMKTDRRLISIVLENLFMKAWNYTGKDGMSCVEFGTTKQNDHEVYLIRTVRSGSPPMTSPLGLPESLEQGLSIVKKILAQFNGTLSIEQNKQSLTFYLAFDQ